MPPKPRTTFASVHRERVTDGLKLNNPLVMLDVFKRVVGFNSFLALSFDPVPFGIPKLLRNGPFTTELRHRSVNGDVAHNRHYGQPVPTTA